jgi:hypothetical protein
VDEQPVLPTANEAVQVKYLQMLRHVGLTKAGGIDQLVDRSLTRLKRK